MKIAGVIAEFNPLHSGHAWLLDQIRAQGYDAIVCVMSSHFVQRGDAAVYDKWTRTHAALLCGADLIVELPACYALASAERFAYAGVSLLTSLGVIDTLFFGSECGEVSVLRKAARQLEELPGTLLRDQLAQGKSYPRALQDAMRDQELTHSLLTPNNILGIEYIKAVDRLGAPFSVRTLRRQGCAHDGAPQDGSASASHLRELIRAGCADKAMSFIPNSATAVFAQAQVYDAACAQRAVLSRLRQMEPRDFARLADTNEGLVNRLARAAGQAHDLESLLVFVKTKRYTRVRLQRIVWNAFLGFNASLTRFAPPYLRILGFNDTGRIILGKARPKLPVSASLKRLTENAGRCAQIARSEAAATDQFLLFGRQVLPGGLDYTHKPVITHG